MQVKNFLKYLHLFCLIFQDDTFCNIDELTDRLVLEILSHIEMEKLDPCKIR